MDRQLINYYPPYLRIFLEMKVLTEAQQPEVEGLWESADQVMTDQFIETASTAAIRRFEKIFVISPKGTESLDERRRHLIVKNNERLPYSIAVLRQQLETLCGEWYSLEVDYDNFTIIVRIWPHAKGSYNDVADLFDRLVPANMVLDQDLRRNQHDDLCNYTHRDLAQYTHFGLREEVIVRAEVNG